MSDSLKILVVEDDDALRDALLITLEAAGHRATGADSGAAALSALATAAREPFSMVVSDLRMDPMDGLTLLGEIRSRHPGLPVLLMTAFGDVDKAVAAMRGGACDFMLKPFEPKTLIEQIARYAVPPPPADGVIAADPKTRETLLLAARVAKTDATVLLTGESGVGKEVFARYIHDQSTRAGGPFVAINCAAIPDTLLEATLFGYEKGAFTGAQTAQAGKFEQANGGTLLLDEISEMPLGLQAKLLRVLQEREVERVGGSVDRINFHRCDDVETCLFEAQAHPANSGEQIDSDRTIHRGSLQRDSASLTPLSALSIAFCSSDRFPVGRRIRVTQT